MPAPVALFAVFFALLLLGLCLVRTTDCTMYDMEVNIPLNYETFRFENYSITRWRDQKTDTIVKEDSPYIIDPDTGQVFLRDTIVKDSGLGSVYGELYRQDEFGYSATTLKVFFSKKPPCSDLEDICFWKNVTYKLQEGTTDIIGWLTSEYYKQLCPSYEVSYKLDDESGVFILLPSEKGDATWSLGNKRPFFVSEMGNFVFLQLNCIVRREKQFVSRLKRVVRIEILDAEDEERQKSCCDDPQQKIAGSISYRQKIIDISRTAAPYARITQPNALEKELNFTIKQGSDIFNITKDGIIFVGNTFKLRQSKDVIEVFVNWIENDTPTQENIFVRVVENSKDKCVFNNWTFCAQISKKRECLKEHLCAIATTGYYINQTQQRCQWFEGSENDTSSYSTCTPDKNTCPDGECDSLERLHPLICPQDCTTSVQFPNAVNPKTNKGIGNGSGVCFCGKTLSCQCEPQIRKMKVWKNQKKKQKDAGVANKNSTTSGNDISENEHAEQHKGKRSLGSAVCGMSCILGIVCGILFLAGIITAIAICWMSKKIRFSNSDKNTESNGELVLPLTDYLSRNFPVDTIVINFPSITSSTNVTNIMRKYSLPDPKWEFPRQQLTIEQALGEGEFGRVLKAKAFNIGARPGYTVVAVKTLKEEARKNDLNDLLSEYQLLKGVSHPNVIQLLGVCTSPGGPIYLIIDFAEYGSLRNYLRKFRQVVSSKEDDHYESTDNNIIPLKDILSFAWQICNGMAYLSDIKLVHRDLAARNVLLDSKMVCKISDFGLTRDVYEDNAYLKKSRTRVPIKWMAPESLSNHIYTSKSDVWSFGILVWELVTLGRTPYPGIDVQNLYTLLNEGYRMERPPSCPVALYNLMVKCWAKDPTERPTFHELLQSWEKLMEIRNDYLDLKNNAILNRTYFASHGNNELNDTNNKEESEVQSEANNVGGYETPNPQQRKVVSANYENQQDYTDMGSAAALKVDI